MDRSGDRAVHQGGNVGVLDEHPPVEVPGGGERLELRPERGAVRALEPERVIIMPEGDEDMWSDEYMEIVELA